MITCDTMDTEKSIKETMELASAGCEIVRITAPTVKDSRNLENIVKGLRERRLLCAYCRRHSFQAGRGNGSGQVGRQSPD